VTAIPSPVIGIYSLILILKNRHEKMKNKFIHLSCL